ncbi:MAG: VWA domain-containing protein [Bacteroidales bacterium]|nr:VWA domain-containing protein [Bacteroidales bacterium]
MKKEFYNLIILDKSGSMMTIRNQAIAGVNETVGTIRHSAKETETVQMVSLMTFCGCSMSYPVCNRPVESVQTITEADYEPCCTTPLYDAIGSACTTLKRELAGKDNACVSVTIITDGYENSSREWTAGSVRALIDSLKAEGWLFAFIGANIDVKKVSFELSIDNSLSFVADEEGTRAMFCRERESRRLWTKSVASACCMDPSLNKHYFSPDGKDNK